MSYQSFLHTYKADSPFFFFFFSVSRARRVVSPDAFYAKLFKLFVYTLPTHTLLRTQTPMLCQSQHGHCPLLLHVLWKLAFTLGWDKANNNTIGMVWWPWQRRREVIKMILTHYFKQTERAPMRGIKGKEEIWQGSTGCSSKEATILCRRNHPAGMKPGWQWDNWVWKASVSTSCLRSTRTFSYATLKTRCRTLKAPPSLCVVLQPSCYSDRLSHQHKVCPKLVLRPSPGPSCSSACWKHEHRHMIDLDYKIIPFSCCQRLAEWC